MPVAVITGAGKGIGKSIAIECAERGYDLALISKHYHDLIKIKEEVKGKNLHLLLFEADISNKKKIRMIFQKIKAKFKKIDLLVNNAGIFQVAPIRNLSEGLFRKVIEVNLFGTFYCTKHALSLMEKGGIVVNISSMAGEVGFSGSGAYCASKHGVNGFSKVLAIEEPELKVLVAMPGPVKTQIWKKLKNTDLKKESKKFSMAKPSEVAKMIFSSLKKPWKKNYKEIKVN